MLSPGISVKRRHGGAGFALRCGCKDAKSVSVSTSPSPSGAGTSTTTETRGGAGRTNPSASTTTTDTLTSSLTSASSSSFVWEDAVAELDCSDDYGRDSSAAAQSFSGLLRELNELEQSVASWGQQKSHRNKKLSTPPQQEDRDEKRLSTPTQEGRVDKKLSTPPREHKKLSAPMQEDHVDKELPTPPREHRKVTPMKSGDHLTLTKGAKAGYRAGDRLEAAGHAGLAEAGLDGSVAVVKQSDDPLGDFRRSMVQMIVENGMVAGEELREMLRRFLSLNAPHHHDVILRAFAEIWAAVFEDDEDSWRDEPDVPATAVPAHKRTTRREPSPSSRPPTMPRTPPRHHHSPSAWRV